MAISILALAMGIILTCVGGYFSIVGLATIFSGAYWSVVIMAGVLEASKVVAASWIYRCWSIAPIMIRVYMTSAVIVLVMITSLGIFGYLSKAHIDQNLEGGNNEIVIREIERKISLEQSKITSSEKILLSLDREIETLQKYDRIRGPDGAIAVRAQQNEDRNSLNQTIDTANQAITILREQLIPLKSKQLELEAEVGPLKYVAEMIYERSTRDVLDSSVRWLTIILVSVFDPLAIILILAGNIGLTQKKQMIMMTEEEIMKDVEISTYGHNLGT